MTAEGQRQDVNSLLLRAIRLGSSEKDDRNDYDWIRVNKKKFFSVGDPFNSYLILCCLFHIQLLVADLFTLIDVGKRDFSVLGSCGIEDQ